RLRSREIILWNEASFKMPRSALAAGSGDFNSSIIRVVARRRFTTPSLLPAPGKGQQKTFGGWAPWLLSALGGGECQQKGERIQPTCYRPPAGGAAGPYRW